MHDCHLVGWGFIMGKCEEASGTVVIVMGFVCKNVNLAVQRFNR